VLEGKALDNLYLETQDWITSPDYSHRTKLKVLRMRSNALVEAEIHAPN